jgi:hypothetical protein
MFQITFGRFEHAFVIFENVLLNDRNIVLHFGIGIGLRIGAASRESQGHA